MKMRFFAPLAAVIVVGSWAFTSQGSMLVDAITPTQVLKNLNGWWIYGAPASGTDTPDGTGRGHTATLVNMTSGNFGTGSCGQSLTFNGTDEMAYAPNSDDYNFFSTNDFTLAAWIYIENDGKYATILEKRNYDFSFQGYLFGFRDGDGDGNMVAYIRNGTTPGNESAEIPANTKLANDTWYHVAATFDRGGNITHYLNGVADGSGSITSVVGSITNTSPLGIGDIGTGSSAWGKWDGKLGDVRIYRRILTVAEIKLLACTQ